jgi:hypothetical protein
MRKNGGAMPAWDTDSDIGYPCGHPISQIGQSIMGELANKYRRLLTRFDRSFGRDNGVAPSTTEASNVAD